MESRFATAPSISVDYALMEKAENVLVADADFEWNDVGHWLAMRELWPDVLFVVLGFFGALALLIAAVNTGWWGLNVVGIPALVFFGILLFSLPGTPTGN